MTAVLLFSVGGAVAAGAIAAGAAFCVWLVREVFRGMK